MQYGNQIQEILDAYSVLVGGIDSKAKRNTTGRAYGGIVRAGKGKMVETITHSLVEIAWARLGKNPERLSITRTQFLIPIKKEYLERLDAEIGSHIRKNIDGYVYHYTPDVLVLIDGKPILEIECKSYTENAMLKRILVDATLVKTQFPEMNFALIQLESQLGGDYSELKHKCLGSPSTHTILSYFDIGLNIITLLKGERHVDAPIHKKKFFKPLTENGLEIAIQKFEEILKKYP